MESTKEAIMYHSTTCMKDFKAHFNHYIVGLIPSREAG